MTSKMKRSSTELMCSSKLHLYRFILWFIYVLRRRAVISRLCMCWYISCVMMHRAERSCMFVSLTFTLVIWQIYFCIFDHIEIIKITILTYSLLYMLILVNVSEKTEGKIMSYDNGKYVIYIQWILGQTKHYQKKKDI